VSKKKILVIASHPDDEILGCGGTMRKLSEEGNHIYVLILGEGITSRQEIRDPEKVKKEIFKLHKEVSEASKIVGAKNYKVLNIPDNRFDSVDLLDIIKEIEKVKTEFKPDVIFTHHCSDLNVDHRITFNAVLTACRPLMNETVKEIYSFEVPSSTEWQYQNSENSFKPNYYVKLDKKHLTAKIKAMEVYSSEKRNMNHPRSPKSLESLAKWRGSNISQHYAECFEVIRIIK
jgi:LmbE family N-acetylglucosaminyl deacetylase